MLRPKPHALDEHLLRELWPLQGRGRGLLRGWRNGRRAEAAFLVRPPRLAYVRSPWGGEAADFAGRTAVTIAPSPLGGLKTFTLEMWVRFDDLFAGEQALFEHVGRAGRWRLALDPKGRLGLRWSARGGRDAVLLTTSHLADQVVPGRWYHLVVSNLETRFLELCLTPVGGRFPRSMRIAQPPPRSWRGAGAGRLIIGASSRRRGFFHGALCDLAVFGHLKRRNEFPALGQRPPRRFTISADAPVGSVLLPVEKGPWSAAVGCRPAPYHAKSMWFCGRLDGVKNREIELEILGWPGSLGMLCSPWVSYDGWNWRHVGGAYWNWEEPHHSAMFFRHRFKDSPAYVAASLPYGLQEVEKLERDAAGSPFVEVLAVSRSCEGRPIRLFKVTDPGVPDRRKQAVYRRGGCATC